MEKVMSSSRGNTHLKMREESVLFYFLLLLDLNQFFQVLVEVVGAKASSDEKPKEVRDFP